MGVVSSSRKRNESSKTPVHEALALYGTPEIFNGDQGSQFTSEAFTSVLLEAGVAISMDGVGPAIWPDPKNWFT